MSRKGGWTSKNHTASLFCYSLSVPHTHPHPQISSLDLLGSASGPGDESSGSNPDIGQGHCSLTLSSTSLCSHSVFTD